MPAIKYVKSETIYKLMTEVFSKLDVPKDQAKICADVLIASDLSGIESHGIGRLKMYYDRIKAGIQFSTTKIDVINDFAATAVWDGNHGMGKVISYRAMQEAIDKAKKFGIGCVTVRNSSHYGIAGFYPKMATKQNMVGMSFTNARPSIAPLNGIQPMLGTNPIAFGAPSDMEFPFLFDAATSISQRGKIEVLGRKKKPTPEFWAIDDQGNPFTETQQLLKELVEQTASLVALGGTDEMSGGHKGYGLATIVEILSSALQAGSFMHALSGFEGEKRVPYKLGHFFMAINPEAFGDVAEFKKTVGDIMRNLQNSTKKTGCERIYVAGEKEFLKEKEILKNGIPINEALDKNIHIMIDELKIEGIEI